MKGTVGYTRGYWLFHLFCAIAFRFSVLQAAFVTRQDATVDESDLTIETFNVSSLCHIEGASSVLINNTLWVNGGVITGLDCGNCTPWLDVNTYVFAIPFEKALTNVGWGTLEYESYRKPKSAPISCRSPLWRNEPGTELYTFSGNFSRNDSSVNYKNVDDNLWSFSTLNQSWSIVSLAPLNWIDLQYTSIPSMDKSFVFGPISEDESRLVEFDSGVSPLEPARLDTANVPTGSLHRGQLIHIPVPGGDGVLIEFGGAKDVAVGEYRDVDLDTVNLYDMATETWFTQRTSTEIAGEPINRHNFCAVMASSSPNSTSFEIYMYGGDFNDVQDSRYINGIWALSIPSFRWFYFEDPDVRVRLSGTTCQIIGPHLIRFGGWRQNNGPYPPPWDPICMNPVSIFNLNSFTWTDRFDPNATPYKAPAKITTWNQGIASPARGWDDGVQALFTGFNTTDHSNSTQTSTPTPTPPPEPEPKKKTNTGAIVGGVIGGLAGLGLIVALFTIKRRRSTQAQDAEPKGPNDGFEPWRRHEMPAFREERPPAELMGST